MTREDMEHLSAFIASLRDSYQSGVDACTLFLNYVESTVLDVPEDPAVWDTLEWEQREKEETGFKYEMLRIDEANDLHRHLRLRIKQKKGSMVLGAYRYNLGRDENVIFRSLTKDKK